MGTISATSVTLTQTDQWVTAPEGYGPSEPLLSATQRAFLENINDRVLFVFNRLLAGLLGSFKTFVAGAVDTGTDTINLPSHGISANTVVRLGNVGGTLLGASGLTAPTVAGLSPTALYVKVTDANNIQLSLTSGGSAINITSAGSGTHYLYIVPANVFDLIVAPSLTMAGETMPAQALKATLGEVLTQRGGTVSGALTLSGDVEFEGNVTFSNTGQFVDSLGVGDALPSLGDANATISLWEQNESWMCVDQTGNHTFTLPDPSAAGLTRYAYRVKFTGGFAAVFKRVDTSTIGRLPGTAASGTAGIVFKSYDAGDGLGLAWHGFALGNADQCT